MKRKVAVNIIKIDANGIFTSYTVVGDVRQKIVNGHKVEVHADVEKISREAEAIFKAKLSLAGFSLKKEDIDKAVEDGYAYVLASNVTILINWATNTTCVV